MIRPRNAIYSTFVKLHAMFSYIFFRVYIYSCIKSLLKALVSRTCTSHTCTLLIAHTSSHAHAHVHIAHLTHACTCTCTCTLSLQTYIPVVALLSLAPQGWRSDSLLGRFPCTLAGVSGLSSMSRWSLAGAPGLACLLGWFP